MAGITICSGPSRSPLARSGLAMRRGRVAVHKAGPRAHTQYDKLMWRPKMNRPDWPEGRRQFLEKCARRPSWARVETLKLRVNLGRASERAPTWSSSCQTRPVSWHGERGGAFGRTGAVISLCTLSLLVASHNSRVCSSIAIMGDHSRSCSNVASFALESEGRARSENGARAAFVTWTSRGCSRPSGSPPDN